ncbi:MAG: hypothetical protein LBS99_01830 [Clostridiales bacterium]|jgi:uncharacterized protein YacL|nr:hypothetical protein [Clostridiales bacterium]
MPKNERKRKVTKSAKMFGRFIFIPLLMATGWLIASAVLTNDFASGIGGVYKILIQAGFALFFGCIGIFITPPLLFLLFAISALFERALKNYSAKEILMGLLGMTIGALAGILLTWLGSAMISPESSAGTAIIVIGVALVLVLGFVGLRIGVKIMAQAFQATNIKKSDTNASAAGANIKIPDSSALIDGRVLDIVRTGFLDGELIIPGFVLSELRRIADCDDILKKNRGRRGLDIAAALQKENGVTVTVLDVASDDKADTETRLLRLAAEYNAKIITNDYNLNKLSSAQNVAVLNINDLSNAIKPIALPGEKMSVKIVKKGKDFEQGVAYSVDGTMIVVENGGAYIGHDVEVTVTTALQTSAGRIIFTRIFD